MRFRNVVLIILCAALGLAALPVAPIYAQQGAQTGATTAQRIDVMRSRLETMRRTLNGAIAGLNAKDSDAKNPSSDDSRTRLTGLEKEVSSLFSEVNDARTKQERAERIDPSLLDKLEAAVSDLDTRVQAGLLATAGERRATGATDTSSSKKKKKGGFFSRILGGSDSDKYEELVGTVAPGRDRQLFEEATKEARKDNYETARALYNVIITTYPESTFLPLSKLAIADTFYLEGTTSALIQAAQAYQDWLTFFPTDPLADDVMLKMAEVEMRRMGLPDRDVSSARKAEQRLKVLLQQFPQTSLRPEVEIRLQEVQEVLAMHNLKIGNHYFERYFQGKASNPKGAQSRYREIVDKWPNFSMMDRVLYRLGITYVQEEEPDEAAKYFQQLVRSYPNSEYADKAREQLTTIGAAAPDPDKDAMRKPAPVEPSFFQTLKSELTGAVQTTVDKNGILISSDSKADDLIKQAIENGGTLPATYNTTPVHRTAPARRIEPAATPATAPKKTDKTDLNLVPTNSGAPATGSDPTRPTTTQPATQTAPATTPAPGNQGTRP